MSGSGADGLTSLGAGASGNISSGAPSGFSMPDGSGNTLFSMPNGGAAMPGQVQSNPMSMGMGAMNGSNLSGAIGTAPDWKSALYAISKANGSASPDDNLMQGVRMGGGSRGGSSAGGFLPSSAVTLPYALSTGGAQSLLQQILNQNKLNPTG
jgi:hypothetical protein